MRSVLALTVVAAALEPGVADAAARRFAWLWDTDTLPERAVELEWWITERTNYPETVAVLTVATVVGLTDNLELAVPFDVVWRPDGDRTELETYGVELRWRLATADRARAPAVVPFVRAAVRRDLQLDAARLEGDIALSVDVTPGVRLVADVGAIAVTRGSDATGSAALGVSVAVTDELGLGAEAYGEVPLASDGPDDGWLGVGPNLALVHGRFWLTAALPIGVTPAAPRFLPRVIWATAF
jgi:hypothetical protein